MCAGSPWSSFGRPQPHVRHMVPSLPASRLGAAREYPSPVALLLLIRHALTEATGKRLSGRTPGIHLSDGGRRQAGQIAERLAPLPLAAVYASPLERCVETAEAIATSRGMAIREEIAGRHPRAVVAIVSHADVIRLVLAHYAGLHIDLFQRLIVSPASVSAIALGDRIPRIIRMNDTGMLDDLAPRKAPSDGQGPSGSRKRPSARPKGT